MLQIYREFPLRAGRVVVRWRTARRDATTVLRADLRERLSRGGDTQAALADALIDQALAA